MSSNKSSQYHNKYYKYKNKYNDLKNQIGGMPRNNIGKVPQTEYVDETRPFWIGYSTAPGA